MIQGLTIGRGSYHARDLSIRRWCPSESAFIGNYCSIADRVSIFCGGGHRTTLVSTWPFDVLMAGTSDEDSRTYKRVKQTVIMNDVWIASGATIMAGVTVGNGAIIGPEAVVFEDVEAFAVMRGNPAKAIRHRFSRAVAANLQSIAWWDWPDEVVRERLEDFYLPVEAFVRKYL